MDLARFLIRVSGKVQKVGFRNWSAEKANKLQLKGFAKNLADGSVEIVIEGLRENARKFIDLTAVGPNSAKVEFRQIKEQTFVGEFEDFKIL
ncbi:MAG TPA: acylphosphatase [Oligoflexia bacterium]|nr:acylphosphatase [Oligoflexia bacterium]HMP27609.1 acylphosphatase [Oligoflexia bacterium]